MIHLKKWLGCLLVMSMVLSMLPATAFAVESKNSEILTLDEVIWEMSELQTTGYDFGFFALDNYGNPEIKDTNHANWIDRLADLPEYATGFYDWLVENSDGDSSKDALIDPTKGTAYNGSYVYPLLELTDVPVPFSYPAGADKATIQAAATEAVSAELSENMEYVAAYSAAVYSAFDRDYPEVFWLSGQSQCGSTVSYSYSTGGSGTGVATYTQVVRFYLKTADGFDVRHSDYRDVSTIKSVISNRDKAVKSITAEASGSRQAQIQHLNHWLTHNNCYNTSGNENNFPYDSHQCISALLGNTGTAGPVCEGYARAFKVLCDHMGIPCVLVSGVSGAKKSHMWNYVQMEDNNWYAVDVTWNDPSVDGISGAVSGYENEDYLLVGRTTQIDGEAFDDSHITINTVTNGGTAFINQPVLADEAFGAGTTAATGFSAMENGWSFINGNEGFQYPSSYSIPEERYTEVFGKEYVATSKNNKGKKYESMMPKWGGNCFGMSATAVLFYHNLLNWDSYAKLYTNDFSSVNDYFNTIRHPAFQNKTLYISSDKDTEITKLIERYQILQSSTTNYKYIDSTYQFVWTDEFLNDAPEEYRGWIKKTNTYTLNHSGSYIRDILNQINSSGEPLLVSMKSKYGGHAVVIRTDRKPQKMSDGWYRVYIYDPNTPYVSNDILQKYSCTPQYYYLNHLTEDRYIELNPKTNQWRYIGGVNSGSTEKYWGSNADGSVRYYKYGTLKSDESVSVMIPEYMFIYSLCDTGIPLSFNGREPWESDSEDSTSIAITGNSDFTVYATDGTEICDVAFGEVLASVDGISYDSYMGTTVDGTGSNGGRITIPYTDFRIEYESGDDISVLGFDSAINVASAGSLTMDISTTEGGSIYITGNEDNEISTQITNLFGESGYTSVEAEGLLEQGDTLTLQLNNNSLEANVTGDSQLDLYTDNDAQPDSQYIMVLDSADGDVSVDNIRQELPEDSPRHTLVPVSSEASTCTEAGHMAYYVCSDCGTWFADADATKVIDNHGSVNLPLADHECDAEVFDPTCTGQGYTLYICAVCGYSYTDAYTDPTGHHYFDGECRDCGAAKPAYYLVGYINGADYGFNEDYENMGQYQFVDGQLVATFMADSYVFLKTEGNANWYLTEAYTTETSATFVEDGTEKMFVPGNVEVTFTLVENDDGSLTLSYTIASTTVSGTAVSYLDDSETTIDLIADGNVQYSVTVTGKNAAYSFENVAPGIYTIQVRKAKHAIREYTVVVGSEDTTLDVKICPNGDTSGDGKINMKDWNVLYEHLNEVNELSDYALVCADVNGDGKVNMKDWNRLYEHLNEVNPL